MAEPTLCEEPVGDQRVEVGVKIEVFAEVMDGHHKPVMPSGRPSLGRRTWYHVERNAWSVHFNISPDGRRFAGDGGDAEMVAKAPDGKWIYLFEPEGIADVAGISAPGADTLVHPGRLRARRLVNLGVHDYRVEPNVRFSPDGRWVIFRANLHGAVHTYAVDTVPAASRP